MEPEGGLVGAGQGKKNLKYYIEIKKKFMSYVGSPAKYFGKKN